MGETFIITAHLILDFSSSSNRSMLNVYIHSKDVRLHYYWLNQLIMVVITMITTTGDLIICRIFAMLGSPSLGSIHKPTDHVLTHNNILLILIMIVGSLKSRSIILTIHYNVLCSSCYRVLVSYLAD